MTRVFLLLLLVPSCIVACNQNLITSKAVVPTSTSPLKNEDKILGKPLSRSASPSMGAGNGIEQYQGVAHESYEVYLERIKPQIETMIRNLIHEFWKQDRHHEGLPELRELLEIYTENFTDDENAAFMNFLFGFIIAEMTHCGCHGSGHSPDEWRKAAQAFARSAFLANEKAMIPWPTPTKGTKIRLAAQRAHALCLSNIANPLDGQRAENWVALAALQALKPQAFDPSSKDRLEIRQLILSIAAGQQSNSLTRLSEIAKDDNVDHDLALVSIEMIIRRIQKEQDAQVRSRWLQQMFVDQPDILTRGEGFPSRVRSCLQGLIHPTPDIRACESDQDVIRHWRDAGRVLWELW